MNVLFLSEQDPRDATSWSGILSSMYRSLRHQGMSVLVAAERSGTLWSKVKRRCAPATAGATVDRVLERCDSLLRTRPIDVVFAPVASGLVSQLKTSRPVVYFSDGTLRSVYARRPFSDYYRLPGAAADSAPYQDLLAQHDAAERVALERSDGVVYPSQWALESARDDYGVAPSKLHLIPIGANVPERDLPTRRPQHPLSSPVKLLYIGADWKRKGGDLILSALDELKQRGTSAHLTVVGCEPEAARGRSDVTVHAYLNKNDRRDLRRMRDLLTSHHFLLLPSRAEAYGVAPAEAMAFGLPAIVSGVGGMSTVVREGIGGAVLSAEATGSDYAAKIIELSSDQASYDRLCGSAFDDYHARLGWNHFGRELGRLFETLVGVGRG